MNGRLDGRFAFVTGGAAGLGRAIVRRLADMGAGGVSFDLDSPEDEVPAGWSSVQGDVADEDDVRRALHGLTERFGRLDIVVANAGLVPPWRKTAELDLEEWDRVFAVNVRGVAITIKQAVPAMRATGGSVIVLGSLNSRRAHPRQCLYTATKHAVLGIVRATALDLGRHDIRVNALGPGPVATDALLGRLQSRAENDPRSADEMLQDYAAETALGRIATDEDVAQAAVFLASDQSAAITGQMIPIDAGLS